MNKKIYSQPETTIVVVKAISSMLAGSFTVSGTTDNVDDLLSRRRNNNWNDDEDDE